MAIHRCRRHYAILASNAAVLSKEALILDGMRKVQRLEWGDNKRSYFLLQGIYGSVLCVSDFGAYFISMQNKTHVPIVF